ncbi:MAG: hypothetical protein AAB596_02170 [Patescibacteria group bacterium]
MPYNQSVIEEQLKKKESTSAGLPLKLFSLSLIIFLTSIFIYIGIAFGYRPYLNSEIKKLESEIFNLTQSIDETKQKQIINFYYQSLNIKNLLNSRITISRIFDLIEKNTYSNVKYGNFSLNVNNKEIRIDGVAPNYETVIKELALFESVEGVEKVYLENFSAIDSLKTKGVSEINFVIKLVLNEKILK